MVSQPVDQSAVFLHRHLVIHQPLDFIMTMFSSDQFTNMTVTEANDTKLVPIPIGEYLAFIEKVEFAQWQKRDDPTVNGVKLRVTWNIDDAALKAELDREKITIRQDIMLDTTETSGLDMGKGKNVGLGRLRAAVDQNRPGVPWSPTMLNGAIAKISTTQRIDDKDPEVIYSEVRAVAHA